MSVEEILEITFLKLRVHELFYPTCGDGLSDELEAAARDGDNVAPPK